MEPRLYGSKFHFRLSSSCVSLPDLWLAEQTESIVNSADTPSVLVLLNWTADKYFSDMMQPGILDLNVPAFAKASWDFAGATHDGNRLPVLLMVPGRTITDCPCF